MMKTCNYYLVLTLRLRMKFKALRYLSETTSLLSDCGDNRSNCKLLETRKHHNYRLAIVSIVLSLRKLLKHFSKISVRI